jgi:predicted ribosome-associated RNA-binding protein Tma20
MYQRNGTPYLFKDDHKSVTPMPSMYMLFEKCPSYSSIKPLTVMPLRIFLKLGVENFIFNGADLMWPGVVNIDTEPALDNSKEYKQG